MLQESLELDDPKNLDKALSEAVNLADLQVKGAPYNKFYDSSGDTLFSGMVKGKGVPRKSGYNYLIL